MNIKLIKFLLGLSAVLAVVIIGEWWYAVRAQKQLIASIEKADKQQQKVAQLPTLELTRQPESSFVNLVNRPLFIQGRRPVNETQPVVAKTKSSAVSEVFNWSLNGIYTNNKKTLFALMTRTAGKVPKDNYRKVTKNGEIDGWIVTKIDKEKVVIQSQGGQEKILLLRKPKPKKSPAVNLNPPPMGNDPAQTPPPVPGQMPPEGMPGAIPEPVPGIPGVPGGMPPVPPDQTMPEVMPEPEIIPEPIPEPDMIPEEPSDIYLENNDNVPLQ